MWQRFFSPASFSGTSFIDEASWILQVVTLLLTSTLTCEAYCHVFLGEAETIPGKSDNQLLKQVSQAGTLSLKQLPIGKLPRKKPDQLSLLFGSDRDEYC